MMIPEYNEDMWIGIYKIIEDIDGLSGEKWNALNDGRTERMGILPPEYQVSHIDFTIFPICGVREFYKDEPDGHIEVFLTEKDLSKIELVDKYFMTREECKEKWGIDEQK